MIQLEVTGIVFNSTSVFIKTFFNEQVETAILSC